MKEITLVHNDPDIINLFKNYSDKITFIDEGTLKGKKKAYQLKSFWGTKLTPFAVIYEDGNAIEAFYSENKDVVKSLINYLNNESTNY